MRIYMGEKDRRRKTGDGRSRERVNIHLFTTFANQSRVTI